MKAFLQRLGDILNAETEHMGERLSELSVSLAA